MYDYLGTFTRAQLLERNSFLRTQIYSLPEVIKTLTTQRDRLGILVETESSESFSITSETGGQSYRLMTTLERNFLAGVEISCLNNAGSNSRFPLRFDALTNNISHGDSVWRSSPKLIRVEDLQAANNIDMTSAEDAIPAQRSLNLMSEFRGVSKRAERMDAQTMKRQYRSLVLTDEIEAKEALLAKFEDEIAALEALLSNEVEVTGSDETTRMESDYPTAGIDLKTDLDSPWDTDRLLNLILPPVAEEGEDQDQVRGQILPANAGLAVLAGLTDESKAGSIAEFQAAFPQTKGIKSKPHLQLLANVYEYGYKTGVLHEFADSKYLIRNPTGTGGDESGLRFLAPNVLANLESLAKFMYTKYSIRLRVTEAWPPSVYHGTLGHYTGNCVDIIFDLVSDSEERKGLSVPKIGNNIITIGVTKSWITSGLNEYVVTTTTGTGKHLHLNFHVRYFNEGALFRLK